MGFNDYAIRTLNPSATCQLLSLERGNVLPLRVSCVWFGQEQGSVFPLRVSWFDSVWIKVMFCLWVSCVWFDLGQCSVSFVMAWSGTGCLPLWLFCLCLVLYRQSRRSARINHFLLAKSLPRTSLVVASSTCVDQDAENFRGSFMSPFPFRVLGFG